MQSSLSMIIYTVQILLPFVPNVQQTRYDEISLSFDESTDKFSRDHERIQDDGMTRCAPGRFPDRTKKWTDEVRGRASIIYCKERTSQILFDVCHLLDPFISQETRLICESNVSTPHDLTVLLQKLNRKKDSGNRHSVDSLRRKVHLLFISHEEYTCRWNT